MQIGDPILIHSLTLLFVGMLPVVGLFISYTPLNGKKWFLLTQAGLVPLISFFFLNAKTVYPIYPPNILYLSYGGFIMLFLLLLTRRHGYDNYNKILGVTLLLTYLLTEWWEIPVFVCGHLGLLGKEYLGSWNQIYLIVTFVLLIYISKLKLNKFNLSLFILPIIFSSIILTIYPDMELYSSNVWMINRFITYLSLGYVFYEGSDLNVS